MANAFDQFDAPAAPPQDAPVAPVQQSAASGTEPFNPGDWAPFPMQETGSRPTGFTPTAATHGFQNARTGEWRLTLPTGDVGNGIGGAAKTGAGPNPFDQFDHPPGEAPEATLASAASNVGAGFNDALASAAGAPVDAMRWLMTHGPANLTGGDAAAQQRVFAPPPSLSDLVTGQSPTIAAPLGGSDSIRGLMGAVGADPRDIPADNAVDRVARGTGSGIAGMVLPFGAAKMAGEAVPLLSTFGHGSLTGNAIAGAGAGLGGGAAEEAAPEPYKPLANFGGQILGGGLSSAAVAGLGALGRAGTKYASDFVAPFLKSGQERLAGEKILGAASNPNGLGGALDAESPQIVPGSNPTTFQLTGDQGLGNLERAAATQNPEAFLGRRAGQNAARVSAINGLAPEGANSGAVSSLLKQHLADLDANTQSLVDAAQQRGAQAVSNLRGSMNDTQAGMALREQLAAAKAAAKTRESALWRAIDPNNSLRLDASPVRQAAGRIEREIPATAKPMDAEERAIFGHAKMAGTAQSFQDLTALRGRLLAAIREERFSNGETPALRRMTQLREAIDDAISTAADRHAQTETQAVASGQMAPEETSFAKVKAVFDNWKADRDARSRASIEAGSSDISPSGEGGVSSVRRGQGPARGGPGNAPGDQGLPGEETVANFDEGAAVRYRGAANSTRERAQTYGSGPVGDVLRQGKGGAPFNVADSQVAARFFNKGSKSFEDVNSFLKAAGNRPEAVAILKDYAAASLREVAENPDGTLNAAKFNKWMADHEGAMRAFPELAEKFQSVAEAQRSIEAAQSVRKAAMDTFQNGVAKHFLGDVDPADAVKAALARPDKSAAFAEMSRLVSGNPDAKAGLQKAIVEHIQKNLIGNTEAGEAGNALIKADQLQTFLKKNRAALSWIFPKEQMDAMEAVAADLQRANRSIAGSKLPGASNTAQDLAAKAKHQVEQHGGSVLSLLVAMGVEHGTENIFAAGAALIGAKVLTSMRSAGIHKINDLVTQAMLDPQLARALVMKVQANGKPDPMVLQTIANRLQAIASQAAVKNAAR